MAERIYVTLAVEDDLSEEIARVLLAQVAPKMEVVVAYNRGGYGYLRRNAKAFNKSARGSVYFMLTDLDQFPCPGALIDDWFGVPLHNNMIFRIAVREVEAWLLAHREAFSKFLGVPKTKLPANPDQEEDPKQCLINLARKSRSGRINKALVPASKSTAKVGPEYNMELTRYVREKWIAMEASKNSESLSRY